MNTFNPVTMGSLAAVGIGIVGFVISMAFTRPTGDKAGFSLSMKIFLYITLIGIVATVVSLVSTAARS